MGLLNGMLSAMGAIGSNPHIYKKLEEGMLTAVTGQNMQQLNESMAREKPGSICDRACNITGEECERCLKEQNVFLASLTELQHLEKAVEDFNNDPQAAAPKKPVKCSLCGAPFENGERACPYCDTPYPKELFVPDIPVSKLDQQKLLLDKATATYKLYSDWRLAQADKIMSGGSNGFLAGLMSQKIGSELKNAVQMNSGQLRQGLQHYQLSCYSDYITGIVSGQYKTIGGLLLDQRREAMQEQSRQNQEFQRQMNEINAQTRERTRAIRQERNQYMNNMLMGSPTHYGGGADRSCYNCTYYSAAAGKCAQSGWDTNAGDYCGCWKLK